MANTIKHKRSSTASATPLTTDLELGELAINTYDGKLFLKKDDGSESIVELGLAGAGGGATTLNGLTDVTITSATTDDVLQYNGSSWVNSPLPAGGFSPSGSVIAFAGSSAPSGWLTCDGSAVSRSTYADLFTAISTTYGVGDGSTTFNLPDLRRRTPVGTGSSDTLGDDDGVAYASRSATLTHSIPAHNHGMNHTHTLPAHYHGMGAGATLNITSSGGGGQTGNNSVNHTHSGTTGNQSANHTHTYTYRNVTFAGAAGGYGGLWRNTSTANTEANSANHTHSFTTGNQSANHTHTAPNHTHPAGNFSGLIGLVTNGVNGNATMTSGEPSIKSTYDSSVLTSGDGQYLYMNYIIKT